MSLDQTRIVGTIGYMGGIMAVPEPFCWAFAQMVNFSQTALCEPGERIHLAHSRFALHDVARNEIAGKMFGDWLLMLDTDMQFEPDFAARLVNVMYRYDLDVVTGIYCFKSPPSAPVLYCHNAELDRYEIIGDWNRTVELFEIGAAGAGCLLIRKRALERIRDELQENPFNREGRYGEDHSFFRRLRKLGIKAYCAWKVEAGHLRFQPVGLADYQAEGRPIVGEYTVGALIV